MSTITGFFKNKWFKRIFAMDKLSHVAVMFTIISFLMAWGLTLWGAILVALTIGTIRELWQYRTRTVNFRNQQLKEENLEKKSKIYYALREKAKFDWLDFFANVLGFILYLLYLDIQK